MVAIDEQKLEHRLTSIESAITSAALLQAAEIRTLSIEVAGVKEQVKAQNSRIGKLESWKQWLAGVSEGKAQISRGQFAFFTVAGPILFTAINIAIKLGGWA